MLIWQFIRNNDIILSNDYYLEEEITWQEKLELI